MTSETQKNSGSGGQVSALSLSPMDTVPGLQLFMDKWHEAAKRLDDSKNVSPAFYSDLEFTFQEGWRESRTNAIKVESAIKKTENLIQEIKADIILDEVPRLIEEKGLTKTQNNADFRNAVIARNERYKQANEHLNKLQAMLSHFEAHMKVLENTSRFIKKQMEYFTRTGIANADLYITSDKNTRR